MVTDPSIEPPRDCECQSRVPFEALYAYPSPSWLPTYTTGVESEVSTAGDVVNPLVSVGVAVQTGWQFKVGLPCVGVGQLVVPPIAEYAYNSPVVFAQKFGACICVEVPGSVMYCGESFGSAIPEQLPEAA